MVVDTVVELRCPEHPMRLFAKLHLDGMTPPVVDGNLLEMACDVCKRRLRDSEIDLVRVLHRYDLTGELVETELVRAEARVK